MILSKLFWSKCRVKILEKFILEQKSNNWNNWFFIRELCRNINEQINSVRRELINLEKLKILKSKEENKKKVYILNTNFPIYNEIVWIFLKNYDPIEELKNYLKFQKWIELITISNHLSNIDSKSNNIVDIFIIWNLDKVDFSQFLNKIFFWQKIKYAIMSEDDFVYRLSYNDKLVLSILKQKWNIFLKDKLKIKEKIGL